MKKKLLSMIGMLLVLLFENYLLLEILYRLGGSSLYEEELSGLLAKGEISSDVVWLFVIPAVVGYIVYLFLKKPSAIPFVVDLCTYIAIFIFIAIGVIGKAIGMGGVFAIIILLCLLAPASKVIIIIFDE